MCGKFTFHHLLKCKNIYFEGVLLHRDYRFLTGKGKIKNVRKRVAKPVYLRHFLPINEIKSRLWGESPLTARKTQCRCFVISRSASLC
ncbi:Uncharacterised protein [Enterobacter cancerogenus]|uniref:Uncharacterized protein n=1 Tax=Enterobacter cancerogenus TaxID=69218 RepID=A0A484YA49_9ENTR|nr:Uncharacterised protein [Enterobacter cancerogenus]